MCAQHAGVCMLCWQGGRCTLAANINHLQGLFACVRMNALIGSGCVLTLVVRKLVRLKTCNISTMALIYKQVSPPPFIRWHAHKSGHDSTECIHLVHLSSQLTGLHLYAKYFLHLHGLKVQPQSPEWLQCSACTQDNSYTDIAWPRLPEGTADAAAASSL